MRHNIIAALAASLSLSAPVTAFSAATPQLNSTNNYPSFLPVPETTTLFRTNAEVALYYSHNLGGIRRSKNIETVTQPSTGIYCIKTPASVKLDPKTLIRLSRSNGTVQRAIAWKPIFLISGLSVAMVSTSNTLKTYGDFSLAATHANVIAFFLTLNNRARKKHADRDIRRCAGSRPLCARTSSRPLE